MSSTAQGTMAKGMDEGARDVEAAERAVLRGEGWHAADLPEGLAGDAARFRLGAAAARLGAPRPDGNPARFFEDPSARVHALAATRHRVRAARERLDADGLAGAIEGARKRGVSEAFVSVQERWLRWLVGEDDLADTLPRSDDAESRVESVALDALFELRAGELESALRHARRAFLMARTEQLGPAELSAALVLARARRYHQHGPLALRIAQSVAARAPEAWLPWARWECRMSSGEHGDETLAALRGELVPAIGPARDDLKLLARLAKGEHPWSAFETHAVPGGLGALLEGEGNDVRSYALCGHGPSVRLPARIAERMDVPRLSAPAHERVDHLLCELAQAAPDAVNESELFARVFGFPFEARYAGTFDVTLHRARKRVGELARLERGGGFLKLTGALAIPDPRTRVPADHSLLRALAGMHRASARELAEEVGVPLRTAQRMLREMASEGTCQVEGQGRASRYVLEDTTFSEPTEAARWKRLPDDDTQRD